MNTDGTSFLGQATSAIISPSILREYPSQPAGWDRVSVWATANPLSSAVKRARSSLYMTSSIERDEYRRRTGAAAPEAGRGGGILLSGALPEAPPSMNKRRPL